MNLNRCINCGSVVFNDGLCGDVNCGTYYSQWDTCPAPKEEEMDIRTGFLPRPEEATERCAATLRAVYERAFWAGIANDLCMEFAHRDALVIVRQWPAMMAELEQEIAK